MSSVVVRSVGIVTPITAPLILDGTAAVRDGRIEHVGTCGWVVGTLVWRGLSFTERHFNGVLLPGLASARTHLQYTGIASMDAGQYRGFDDWARTFDRVYNAGGLDWGGDAAAGARLLLESGTTAAADVVTDTAAASILHDAGLHSVTYQGIMSWSNEEWRARGEREVPTSLDVMSTPPAVGISLHAPYSLDAEPLLNLPSIARRRGMRIRIYLGESYSEAEWSETRTAVLADLWKSEYSSSFTAMRSRGGGFSSTQFVGQLGVLGPDCHVAHGVYIRADDHQRLRIRQTTVALCPRSNRVIGLDAPPIGAYLTKSNMIAVSTDSLSSSPSLDLSEDITLLFDLAQAQGYEDQDLAHRLLQAAALDGATAISLATGPDRLSQLQPGVVTDMCVIDVPVTSAVETIDTVIHHGADRVIETVVSGHVRYSTSH